MQQQEKNLQSRPSVYGPERSLLRKYPRVHHACHGAMPLHSDYLPIVLRSQYLCVSRKRTAPVFLSHSQDGEALHGAASVRPPPISELFPATLTQDLIVRHTVRINSAAKVSNRVGHLSSNFLLISDLAGSKSVRMSTARSTATTPTDDACVEVYWISVERTVGSAFVFAAVGLLYGELSYSSVLYSTVCTSESERNPRASRRWGAEESYGNSCRDATAPH